MHLGLGMGAEGSTLAGAEAALVDGTHARGRGKVDLGLGRIVAL